MATVYGRILTFDFVLCRFGLLAFLFFFFFFQAEDGIRDWSVTGFQTCALPICPNTRIVSNEVYTDVARENFLADREMVLVQCEVRVDLVRDDARIGALALLHRADAGERLEEGRVGKECRSRWWTDCLKKKKLNY